MSSSVPLVTVGGQSNPQPPIHLPFSTAYADDSTEPTKGDTTATGAEPRTHASLHEQADQHHQLPSIPGSAPKNYIETDPLKRIPQSLQNALVNSRDRIFVLRLEKELILFINTDVPSLELKQMNSYYRLLSHQVADYYRLGHVVSSSGNTVIVYKTPNSKVDLAAIPKLANVITKYIPNDVNSTSSSNNTSSTSGVSGERNSNATPASFKLMKRDNNVANPVPPTSAIEESDHVEAGTVPDDKTPDSTYSDHKAESANSNDPQPQNDGDLESKRAFKEAEYLKARERIFKDFSQPGEGENEESSKLQPNDTTETLGSNTSRSSSSSGLNYNFKNYNDAEEAATYDRSRFAIASNPSNLNNTYGGYNNKYQTRNNTQHRAGNTINRRHNNYGNGHKNNNHNVNFVDMNQQNAGFFPPPLPGSFSPINQSQPLYMNQMAPIPMNQPFYQNVAYANSMGSIVSNPPPPPPTGGTPVIQNSQLPQPQMFSPMNNLYSPQPIISGLTPPGYISPNVASPYLGQAQLQVNQQSYIQTPPPQAIPIQSQQPYPTMYTPLIFSSPSEPNGSPNFGMYPINSPPTGPFPNPGSPAAMNTTLVYPMSSPPPSGPMQLQGQVPGGILSLPVNSIPPAPNMGMMNQQNVNYKAGGHKGPKYYNQRVQGQYNNGFRNFNNGHNNNNGYNQRRQFVNNRTVVGSGSNNHYNTHTATDIIDLQKESELSGTKPTAVTELNEKNSIKDDISNEIPIEKLAIS